MGTLRFVRQTRDTITEVSLQMDRMVAEKPTDSRSATQLHLISVFGGDQEVGAVAAATGRRYVLVDSHEDAIAVMRRRLAALGATPRYATAAELSTAN